MKVNVYAVFDEAAKAYMQPFTRATDGLAIRDFTAAVNDTSTTMCQHPHQFTLFKLGTFDDNTGEIRSDQQLVLSALQVKTTPVPGAQQELLK